MNFIRSFLIVALMVAGLALPLQAQGKQTKLTPRAERLAAAVLAVSPDALGGRLGLDLATTRSATAEVSAPPAARVTANSTDQLAYQAWKAGRKS